MIPLQNVAKKMETPWHLAVELLAAELSMCCGYVYGNTSASPLNILAV